MTFLQIPQEHVQFDALCAEIEDYEPLPEATSAPWEPMAYLSDDEQTDSIDAEILAGLVSP